jgi:hypothetical protein
MAALALGAAFTAMSATVDIPPQQLVYESQATLPGGARVGIVVPNFPVALGVQSMSGPRAMVVGQILRCKPFEEITEIFVKTATGEMQSMNDHHQLLNCGKLTPDGEDRILMVVGIQWREKR